MPRFQAIYKRDKNGWRGEAGLWYMTIKMLVDSPTRPLVRLSFFDCPLSHPIYKPLEHKSDLNGALRLEVVDNPPPPKQWAYKSTACKKYKVGILW